MWPGSIQGATNNYANAVLPSDRHDARVTSDTHRIAFVKAAAGVCYLILRRAYDCVFFHPAITLDCHRRE